MTGASGSKGSSASGSAAPLRWEWGLANGARIAAELDTTGKRETVMVGGRVVSGASRGDKPDGHAFTAPPAANGLRPADPIDVVVTFDPRAPFCILRVDGFEVAPAVWPVKGRGGGAPPPAEAKAPIPTWMIATGIGVVALAAGLAFYPRSGGVARVELSVSHRDPSGLFVAHYPPGMKLRPAVVAPPLSGVVLDDERARGSVVVVARMLDPGALRDGWALQAQVHEEAFSNVPRVARSWRETARRDDTCVGEPGAVVVGRLTRPDESSAMTWSCAFVRDGRGYFVGFVLPEGSDAHPAMRRVVEATELTQLAALPVPATTP